MNSVETQYNVCMPNQFSTKPTSVKHGATQTYV
jgi:hypothetical protein